MRFFLGEKFFPASAIARDENLLLRPHVLGDLYDILGRFFKKPYEKNHNFRRKMFRPRNPEGLIFVAKQSESGNMLSKTLKNGAVFIHGCILSFFAVLDDAHAVDRTRPDRLHVKANIVDLERRASFRDFAEFFEKKAVHAFFAFDLGVEK